MQTRNKVLPIMSRNGRPSTRRTHYGGEALERSEIWSLLGISEMWQPPRHTINVGTPRQRRNMNE